ncbi:MAG: hypothetical protein E7611_00950 [Ruminococcaceae bacterium]|nr:hypothetical protein [Oscillospiraceae bacterium]
MDENKKEAKKRMDPKKKVKIIIASMIGALILCILLAWLIDVITNKKGEYIAPPPVDPLKLHETKDEDFDIMEYEEYLNLNRNVYRNDRDTGVSESIDEDNCTLYGQPFEVMYRVIRAINEGDHLVYNYYVGESSLKKQPFTQQQIYDIVIVPYSYERVTEESFSYDQYIFKVTYKIHENNGTFRNNIVSDVSRPEYYYINNKTGEFKVMKVIEQGYK